MSSQLSKSIVVSVIVLSISLLLLCYLFITRPLGLYDLIEQKNIKDVQILTSISSESMVKVPEDLKLTNEQDISTFMNILNKYKYKKIFKYYNPKLVPSKCYQRCNKYIY